jgi:O-antigen/teichoic acid export membrane protein
MDVTAARLLGAHGSGMFFQMIAVVTIAAVVGRGGMDNTLLRFTASHEAAAENGLVRAVGRAGIRMALRPLVVMAVALFIAAPTLASRLLGEPDLAAPLRVVAWSVVPVGFLQLLAQMLRGVGRIVHSVLVQSVWLPALMVVALFAAVPENGILGASYAYVGAGLVTMGIGGYLWRGSTRSADETPEYDRGAIRASSRPLYAVAIMQLVFQWGTIVILGIFQPSSEVALFSAASRTAMLLSFVLLSINQVVGPKFAALHRVGDVTALATVARDSAKLMATVSLPGLLVLLLFPRWVMGVFGPEFTRGVTPLIILSLGQYVNVVTGSVGLLLIMTGRETAMRNVHTLSFVLTVALAIVLSRPFGATGAAVASASGLAVKNLVAALVVRRHMGFWSIPLWPWGVRDRHRNQ